MIDVVVPVYGKFWLVAQCVDALLNSADIGRVIIVDDASPDDSIAEYADLRGVECIRLAENTGFVGAANIGMDMAETQYAVLVNSDTVPLESNSLRALVYAMNREKMKLAAPKALFMQGSRYGRRDTIQHAGVAFGHDGVPYHPFMHLHRDTAAANVERKVNAVSGAVLAVHLKTWRAVSGFDEHFAPGVYEDVDLCLRVGGALYVPQSEWYHLMHGSQTPQNDLFDNEGEHLGKLLHRWGKRCDEGLFYG